MAEKWIVRVGSKQSKPHSTEEIRRFLKAGKVPEDALLSRDGENWLNASSFVADHVNQKGRPTQHSVSQEGDEKEVQGIITCACGWHGQAMVPSTNIGKKTKCRECGQVVVVQLAESRKENGDHSAAKHNEGQTPDEHLKFVLRVIYSSSVISPLVFFLLLVLLWPETSAVSYSQTVGLAAFLGFLFASVVVGFPLQIYSETKAKVACPKCSHRMYIKSRKFKLVNLFDYVCDDCKYFQRGFSEEQRKKEFTQAAEEAANDSLQDRAANRLKWPLVCLGCLALLWIVFSVVMLALGIASGAIPVNDVSEIGPIVLSLVSSVLIFVGVKKARRFESYNWALTASILGSIPILSPFGMLGIPAGIYIYICLRYGDVKRAFAEYETNKATDQ